MDPETEIFVNFVILFIILYYIYIYYDVFKMYNNNEKNIIVATPVYVPINNIPVK